MPRGFSHAVGELVADPHSPNIYKIMTDFGLREAVGQAYFPDEYPVLFEAIGYKYGRDRLSRFKVPDMRGRAGVISAENILPASITTDKLQVNIALNDNFTKGIKKLTESPLLRPNEVRHMLGIEEKPSIFDDFDYTAVNGTRMKWGGSSTSNSSKENNMSDRRLKTPSETIERKDLTVALKVMGTVDQDYLLDAIAQVQELNDNQELVRVYQLRSESELYLGKQLSISGKDVSGELTDIKGEKDYPRSEFQLVVGGKLYTLLGMELAVVTTTPEKIDSMIDVVQNPDDLTS